MRCGLAAHAPPFFVAQVVPLLLGVARSVKSGDRQSIEGFRNRLVDKFDMKTPIIVKGKDDMTSVNMLNRIVSVSDEGFHYEAEPKHVSQIARRCSRKIAIGLMELRTVPFAGERISSVSTAPTYNSL